jgi:hypothetical protein
MNVGGIVQFRNRQWVILPSEESQVVLLRPLTGTSEDVVAVHRQLAELVAYTIDSERISPSAFPSPSPDMVEDAQSVPLFWQAARLLLREGAATFRSQGP